MGLGSQDDSWVMGLHRVNFGRWDTDGAEKWWTAVVGDCGWWRVLVDRGTGCRLEDGGWYMMSGGGGQMTVG